jgi:hypothetical protein
MIILQTVGLLGRVISSSQTSMPCVGFEPTIPGLRPLGYCGWPICSLRSTFCNAVPPMFVVKHSLQFTLLFFQSLLWNSLYLQSTIYIGVLSTCIVNYIVNAIEQSCPVLVWTCILNVLHYLGVVLKCSVVSRLFLLFCRELCAREWLHAVGQKIDTIVGQD